MTLDLIKFGFVAGEVAESYFGRSDLEKFDLALATCENFFVDYHGGISNVPGTEFIEYVKDDEFPTKFFSFKFSSEIANTNLIVFGKNYVRFIQDGAYVLEGEINITGVSLTPRAIVTAPGHGLASGDWIVFPSVGSMLDLLNRTCVVEVINTNTFYILDPFGNYINSVAFMAFGAPMTCARIYTIESPYHYDDLAELQAQQVRDVIRLTHRKYKIRNLVRYDQADWAIELENLDSPVQRPNQPTLGALKTNEKYSAGYAVTAINEDGVESLPSNTAFITDIANAEVDTQGGVTVKWSVVAGAVNYRVYRTRFSFDANGVSNISRSFQLGYIGESQGGYFLDPGITPDFTRTPPVGYNPFADGAIRAVTVLSAPGPYSNSATISVSDPSADAGGFIGAMVIAPTARSSANGPCVGVQIIEGGHDYTDPTMTFGGSGSATVKLSPLTGNNPRCSAVFQQRQIYAATDNAPLTVYGSVPGQLSNFTTSRVLVADDSFEHEIDSQNFSAIKHLVATRGGLLVFSPAGIWLMSGSQKSAITATDVQADQQVYSGVSDLAPLTIDTDILYADANDDQVNALAYADQYKLYSPTDISILSSHMFWDRKLLAWGYAESPHKIILAARDDGTMLILTMIKDQEIYAWTRRTTRGKFVDLLVMEENSRSSTYVMVERNLNGRMTKVIERIAPRVVTPVEDGVFLDAALKLGGRTFDAALRVWAQTGSAVKVTASAPVFISSMVGHILRYSNGKAKVTAYVSPSELTVQVIRPFDLVVPHTDPVEVQRAAAHAWTLDPEISTVYGLHHFEGMTVSVVADGAQRAPETVVNGRISIGQAASRIIIGLPYRCVAKNLPINVNGSVVEDKVKRVVGLAVRVKDTIGLKAGNRLDSLYEVRARTAEVYGEGPNLRNGITEVLIDPIWNEEGQSYFVQDAPMPVTILGYVAQIEVGDDPG
jgi:hypothetical protein